MPKPPAQMKVRVLPLTGTRLSTPLDLSRRGMPALDSIHSVVKFKRRYQIVKSTEIDSYEESTAAVAVREALTGRQPSSAALAAAMKARAPKGDNFGGTQRKAAKISIATGRTKTFKTVSTLITSLPTDEQMIKRKPKIRRAANSGRVSEEMRNVGVSAFLYAASREDDSDFHLIIGGDPQGTPEMYMTMELSGLPPKTSPAFAKLNTARNAYKKFFGTNLPGLTYDFYSPPIPVKVKGSLFFDVGHATGSRPGPASLKSRMPTVWEVHPITSIELGP
jgi:hypothetical protein